VAESLGGIGEFLLGIMSVIGGLMQIYALLMLNRVHKTTNSLAARNEAIARELGVAEGTAAAAAKDQS
jgi:hypothetical protein